MVLSFALATVSSSVLAAADAAVVAIIRVGTVLEAGP